MRKLLFVTILCAAGVLSASSQSTAFTYQGRLTDAALPANGSYDLQFALFDLATGGTQQGSTATVPNVTVTNGIFSVQLDFGAQFPGTPRFLEISVQHNGGGFITLTPRQQILSVPYAVRSTSSASADSVGTLSSLTVSGALSAGSVTVTGLTASAPVFTDASKKLITASTTGSGGIVVLAGAPTLNDATATSSASSTKPLVVKGAAAQSANLQEWQNSSGTAVASVSPTGAFTGDASGMTHGQPFQQAFGTGLVTITPSTGFTLIPGESLNLTVPSGSTAVLVTSSGGIQTTSLAATGFSMVDIVIFVDGNVPLNGPFIRLISANTTGFTNGVFAYWSRTLVLSLTPGVHTISVQARGTGSGSNATVGGDNNSVLQSVLTANVIRQ